MLPFFYTFYRFGRGIWSAFKDPEFQVLLVLTAIVLGTGTLFYHEVQGWSLLNSLYFSVVTLTTVGYGDLYPTTDVSKIFTMIYLIIGIGILFGFINTIAHYAVEDSKAYGFFPKRLEFWRKHDKGDEIEST